MIALTLYSKPGCHLCDDMKATIARVARDLSLPVAVEEVDISTDRELESRFALQIPVLMMNGKRVAKYRVTEGELARILKAGEAG
jgi:glutaredoxin